MDAPELLRRYCINDPRLAANDADPPAMRLEWRTAALVRISALIAVGAPDASMRTAVDDAIAAGVEPDEIIAVLDGLVGIVGLPRVVAQAPRIAVALGYGDGDDLRVADD
ncbi:carboxymuconolactone decarboxylase family protein [Microbacterium jejuense]|uniref:Carboxymuconolactone decarboxylase family protein n=1 Tax=Microbacterium jejuense TaxID=1263637 RepID=A0ABS7HKC5_9MICO|nr:carboxymuconolactone decarboxylase family protein [Microbacterium jejuense]MBW9092318.1 carboxymuconolactone decarboxylase family protein [Microbacterium jejuense]